MDMPRTVYATLGMTYSELRKNLSMPMRKGHLGSIWHGEEIRGEGRQADSWPDRNMLLDVPQDARYSGFVRIGTSSPGDNRQSEKSHVCLAWPRGYDRQTLKTTLHWMHREFPGYISVHQGADDGVERAQPAAQNPNSNGGDLRPSVLQGPLCADCPQATDTFPIRNYSRGTRRPQKMAPPRQVVPDGRIPRYAFTSPYSGSREVVVPRCANGDTADVWPTSPSSG